jgi:NTE family protein
VVLGGGGARGLAHVGILKVLQREQIPIDVITGTSMGGIVGAMHAVGLSPEQMEAEATKRGEIGQIFARSICDW